jgi:signal recognition particle receptor subunit beta
MPPRAKARSSKQSRQVKIVITGPYGAGKTTMIKTMSEIAVLSTERKVTGKGEREVKSNTTVAMDFGRMTIDAELVLYLFGTPGQKRFDFMWEILSEGMLGFVVLVDHSREESFEEAAGILSFFTDGDAEVPFVVAVNKGDGEEDGGVAVTRERLGLADGVRCVPVNALEKDSVKGVLLELLYAVLDEIEDDDEVPAEAASV